MFGVLLVAVGQDGVADFDSERFQFLAVEVRPEANEQVDIPVAARPRPAGGAPNLNHVGVHRQVADCRLGALRQLANRRSKSTPFCGVGLYLRSDRRDDLLEPCHRANVSHERVKAYR